MAEVINSNEVEIKGTVLAHIDGNDIDKNPYTTADVGNIKINNRLLMAINISNDIDIDEHDKSNYNYYIVAIKKKNIGGSKKTVYNKKKNITIKKNKKKRQKKKN